MKKIVMIVLMVSSVSVFGLDHGFISGFEVGYNETFTKLIEKDFGGKRFINLSDTFNIKMIMGYRVGNLRLTGTYTNTLEFMDLTKYNPLQDDYKIDLNYVIGNFTIGAYHYCNHPVITQEDNREVFENIGHTEIYIRWYKEF